MRRSQIERWLIDTVIVNTTGSIDEYGVPTTTSETAKAKVVHQTSREVDLQTGLDFTSTTRVVTLHALRAGDTLTIEGSTRPVRSIKRGNGMRGGTSLTTALL